MDEDHDGKPMECKIKNKTKHIMEQGNLGHV